MEETRWIDIAEKKRNNHSQEKEKQGVEPCQFREKNQTESLILAQDERWRRA